MPTCQHCHEEWSYKDCFKKLFRNKMSCPYCGNANYLTTESRWKINLIYFPGMIITFLLLIFDVPFWILVSIAILIIMISFAIAPYYLELSEKEEPLHH